jgi:hypothetical protein
MLNYKLLIHVNWFLLLKYILENSLVRIILNGNELI